MARENLNFNFEGAENNVFEVVETSQPDEKPFTEFEKINPSVDLESLNLNWAERDLPEKARTKHVHRLHPYLGKYVPQLVEIFLRKYEPKTVYDPFCGSGTTLVEANVLGIESIGCDISEFNILLTKAKTDKYDVDLLEREALDILSRVKGNSENWELVYSEKYLNIDRDYIDAWFSAQARKELLSYLSLIQDYQHQNLLKIILSRAARSSRLVKHFDLDFPKLPQTEEYYCYKHRRTCSPVQEAFKFLNRYTIDTIKRIKEFNIIRKDVNVDVIHGDSRTVNLPREIDLVITSPPYVGLIDYHEQHKYSYALLGLENNEHKEIGPANEGRSLRAKEEYIIGINQVILNARKYMKDGGKFILVVNDKFDLYKPKDLGFRSIERIERHVNRRTGRRAGNFYESILVWEKL